jgi:hypothetical protein
MEECAMEECAVCEVSDDDEWFAPLEFRHDPERVKTVTVTKQGKTRSVYDVYEHTDGTLRGGCYGMCPRQFHDYAWFAPAADWALTAAKHARFLSAYDSYKTAHALGDREACLVHRAILVALRLKRCSVCRPDPGYLGPAQRACKEWWDAKRQEMCALNKGCAHQDCPERGPGVWCVLEADHGTNPKATHKKTGTPLGLGSYTHWTAHGGVPAMEIEAEQIEKWICRVCHRLEPTSKAGRRCADPTTMPAGKANGTALEKKQYHARHSAVIKYPKHQHVDAAKRRLGACAACARPVEPGTEPGFDFDHLDESTKARGGLFGDKGGVAGLVSNSAKAAALDAVRDLLDAEMAKCQLLCANCHARKTFGYEASTTEF